MLRGIRKRSMRWLSATYMALGAAGLAGCTRPLFMTPETQHFASTVALPSDIATNPEVDSPQEIKDQKAPPTVLDTNRDPRPMSLQEALAIALERGSRGNASMFLFQNFNLGTPGLTSGFSASYSDDLVQFTGNGVTGDDAIRAFALDPAIAAANIEGALAKFDARFVSSMSWNKQDTAVANIFNNFNNGDFAALSAGIIKPLPTGGTTSLTFNTNYSKLSNVPAGFAVINPSYTPSITLAFEQPILRDFGVDINQLLPQHPTPTQIQGYEATGGRPEGIVVTRIRAEQAKADFERELTFLVFNVEVAYWSLYGRYYTKYAAEQALRQAYITWEQLKQLLDAGLQTKQGVAQARAQFEDFRLQYLVALQNVLEGERRLRGILGLPLEDGKRIVPSDTPILAPYKPDWNAALAECMAKRPELRMSRQDLRAQQLNLMLQQNNTRPDLRFFGNYNVNAIGNRLDGPGPVPTVNSDGTISDMPGNALGALSLNRFNSWTTGVRLDIPFGYRDAYASMKVAQLNLARSHVVLKNQERKAELFLGSLYQQLAAYNEQIVLQQARRVALGTQLQGQFERVKIGKDPLIQLLDAQRSFSGSIQAESDAIVSYNIAIAGFQFAKGTILEYNGITIGDGPLPAAISERAADHFAARSAALKLRERPIVPARGADPGVPVPLPGLADGPPIPESKMNPKADADAPPIFVPSADPKAMPMVIPPSIPGAPKDPSAPKDDKKDGKSTAIPAPLPVSTIGDDVIAAPDPVLPLAGTTMPATPVSKYRPK